MSVVLDPETDRRLTETLDRIESNLNNIHYNLDKSDRLLRGIESLPAYIGNAMKKKKRPPPPAPVRNDHSVRSLTRGITVQPRD